jgi:hypothetical protein
LDWKRDVDARSGPAGRDSNLPRNREELEEMFSGGRDPGFTKAELLRFAREFMGLKSHARWMRKSDLITYFQNPDMRPTILAQARKRSRSAQEGVAERRRAVEDGLRERPGKWRFGAVSRLSAGSRIDAITGREFSDGIIVRDLRTKEYLQVANTTATEMRRRRRLLWFDITRLPVADKKTEGEETSDRMIDENLESVPSTQVAPELPSPTIDELLDHLLSDGR